jgi:predicted CoA-binding protein
MTPRQVLESFKTFAIVGLSPRPERPSNDVALFLKAQGYRIVPVNPEHDEILGEPCFPDIPSIPFPIQVVDIFRRSEHVAGIVDQAIEIGAKAVWMQIGVIDADAAERAREAGLHVVMDRCPKIEFYRA